MKLHVERKNDTLVLITAQTDHEELLGIKQKVLKKLAPQVKVAGFRNGKVPFDIAEKHLDQATLQTECIDEAVNTIYITALKEERLRPVSQPKVEITKFVPFSVLEVRMEIPVVGEIKLPNYKKLKAVRTPVKVAKSDIDGVIKNLQQRAAKRKSVERSAKIGDEVIINFVGKDSKGKSIDGAEASNYTLLLGSGAFIPGFEDNVVGMKPNTTKEFTVTFPRDYTVESLKNAKVTFHVSILKIQQLETPKVDDAFAKTIGPFTTVAQLREDISRQLEHEKRHQAEREYENKLVQEISGTTHIAIPEVLLNEQADAIVEEVRQNVVTRGMTYQEYLKSLHLTEEEFIKKEVRPEAERRIKAGLVLSEIADVEGIDVTPEELESRLQQLKGQYSDATMQGELEKPENLREIQARLRSEKVIQFLKTQ
jgi:trigger factor